MTENHMQLTAPVFNIQTFSIYDGPGIRVTVSLKGCPLHCLWCASPESVLATPQLMTDSDKCTGCCACLSACPKRTISIGETEGRFVAVTDRRRCINCGTCIPACPERAREITGEEMTVDTVLKTVLRDKMFMDATGGGITVSGGECLLYPDFTEALLCAAKTAGLHTAVESCAFASRTAVDQVFRYADLALLDIKHMNPALHKKYTGVPNWVILENIRHIANDLQKPAMISIPVIPGYNDDDGNIIATAKFVAEELTGEVSVRLLPYHRLGESKNRSLGKRTDFSIEIPSDEHMQHLKEIAESFGLKTQIGG